MNVIRQTFKVTGFKREIDEVIVQVEAGQDQTVNLTDWLKAELEQGYGGEFDMTDVEITTKPGEMKTWKLSQPELKIVQITPRQEEQKHETA